MYTANATITDVICDQNKVWIQLCYNKAFPMHYEFDLSLLKDIEDLMTLMRFIGVNEAASFLKGKEVRVIDTGEDIDSLVAIGSTSKNKFIALKLDMFPTSEEKIYRKYGKK